MKNCLKIENEDPFFVGFHSRNMDWGAGHDILVLLGLGPKKTKK